MLSCTIFIYGNLLVRELLRKSSIGNCIQSNKHRTKFFINFAMKTTGNFTKVDPKSLLELVKKVRLDKNCSEEIKKQGLISKVS